MSRHDRRHKSHWNEEGRAKRAYDSKGDAEHAAMKTSASAIAKYPLEVYMCRKCKKFHLGRAWGTVPPPGR